ncbi:tRNA-dihydrouridine(47) synthase [Blastocystis sp. ATCC 50177/Nand II]|uniref:tRNA-dihydrouridine(47) synthase [NAD(P)(+)] n=1 Tax=Blastocystis sp. subtype 1 (strain ATCC 50177 / NandII) TaxID=478820 RepID=A0A196SP13_BLAHN|nr:tRNA-dihydrouridine(47) synthase [Blastocystis sp. ATCC 50177/Nand II]
MTVPQEEGGVVKIKREYLIQEQRQGDANSKEEKKSRKRMSPETTTESPHVPYTLCKYVEHGKTCPFGRACRHEHDIHAFFRKRDADIGSVCPVWNRHGYCPSGMNCRWASSHTDWKQLKTIEKKKEEQIPIVESNRCDAIMRSIHKKEYVFQYTANTLEDGNSHLPIEDPGKRVGCVVNNEPRPIDFRNKIYIAPMTTVGNLPFRRICVDFGADITCSEMVIARNLLKAQSSEWALIRRHPSERLFGVQFAIGREEDACAVCELARREMDVDFVDLNAGCPMNALEHAGAGAGLLTKVGRLKRIVSGMLNNLGSLPLVVKIRTGDHENTSHRLLPQLQALRGRGGERVQAVTIHGRTKQARYTTAADWAYIRTCAAAQRTDLPAMEVIGNGDVLSEAAYWECLAVPGVDGVMIGRGALIKPWLLTELKERRTWDISAGERLEIIKKFCDYGLEHWGSDEPGVARTRRFLLEWLSFLCRYVPVGLLERPQGIRQRVPAYCGRSELETVLGSREVKDWVWISERFLGKVEEGFSFTPKHRSNAYSA